MQDGQGSFSFAQKQNCMIGIILMTAPKSCTFRRLRFFSDFTDSNTFFNSFKKPSDVPGPTLTAVSKTQFLDEQYNFNNFD